jgi:hypothetical protein
VPSFLHIPAGIVNRHRAFWLWLGRRESSLLVRETQQIPVRMPIYVCGLARAGSTLLHESITAHGGVATQRVKDYPMVFTPYWWRRATANMRSRPARERLHRDGVMITTESPDALEEMLWTAFVPRCHNPAVCGLLGAGERIPRSSPSTRPTSGS